MPARGTDAARQPAPSASAQDKSPSPFVAVTATDAPATPRPAPTPRPLATLPPPLASPSFPLPTANLLLDYCLERKPADDDLLAVVTTTYGLSAKYTPGNLTSLDQYLSYSVVYSPSIKVRFVAAKPLVNMIHAMQAASLRPIIRSGYRSYEDQAAARQKWEEEYPDRAGVISAQPGHSEHQLGLAVDFGSPELVDFVGDPTIEFHTDFAHTSEGVWLSIHAHEYGFSMSYPEEGYAFTGYEYEPWHYRYVGVELAKYLWDTKQFLTKLLLDAQPVVPCVP